MLLNNEKLNNNMNKEFNRYFEIIENKNTTTQHLWDKAKAVLRGKFVALKGYLKKQEKAQINNLTLHLKELEKAQ